MTKKESKLKAQKTKQYKEGNRIKDDKHLRDILTNKLVWATNEQNKGLKLIEETKVKVLKLNGMVILINEVLNSKKEEK